MGSIYGQLCYVGDGMSELILLHEMPGRISLADLGINDCAFAYEDIKQVLDKLYENNFVILGGDVYHQEQGRLKLTGDSWHYNCKSIVPTQEEVRESRDKALSYISNYYALNGAAYIYSVVAKSNVKSGYE